jgi:hypothetical protein
MILFSDSSHPSHGKAVAALEQAYASYKGDLVNVMVDISKPTSKGITEAFEITPAKVPTLRCAHI